MQPHFGTGSASATAERAGELAGSAIEAHLRNLAEMQAVAEREEHHLTDLAAEVAPAPVVRVPLLATDVHDLDGLGQVADHLLAAAGVSSRPG
jgi:hypothetical protein